MKHPTIDRTVIHGEATFVHQFFDVPVTEGIREIPTNALEDHVALKMAAFEGYRWHIRSPLKRPHATIAWYLRQNPKAVAWKMVQKHIREDLKAVQKDKEPPGRLRYLADHQEADELIQTCRGSFRSLVITALHTGMRRGEILGLTWDQVNMAQGMIRLTHTKNGESREIPINDTVRSVLAGLRTRIDVPWVFHDEEGYKFKNTRKRFEAACKRVELTNFHFHDLRHTFASWLVMAGVPLITVSELMGHKSITMTMRYAHLSPQHKAHAVCSLDKNLTIGAKTAV